MSDPINKRVDESWKEQVEREKQVPPAAATGPAAPGAAASEPAVTGAGPAPAKQKEKDEEGLPEARFDLFISGLAMEALISLGDAPHPVTQKQSMNPKQARYLIDLLGVIEEKTRGNLAVDEERLVKDVLYQLRTRYLNKFGGA